MLSSAGLDRIVSRRIGRKVGIYEALRIEVATAKARGGFAGINIMVALQRDLEASVRGVIDAGADAIVSGAGLALSLPGIQAPRGTALVPIVSSARALDLICRRWERLHCRPDDVVLEGPQAGGHLGFRADQAELEENKLERLLPPVKETAMAHGDFPVIVAGGINSHEDVRRFLALGVDRVQRGTRFLATDESSASPAYKRAVVRATPEDMLVANTPGSPCGFPFHVLRESPMFQSALVRTRLPRCDKGYVLIKDAHGRYALRRRGVQREVLLHLRRALQRRELQRRRRGAAVHGRHGRGARRPQPVRERSDGQARRDTRGHADGRVAGPTVGPPAGSAGSRPRTRASETPAA